MISESIIQRLPVETTWSRPIPILREQEQSSPYPLDCLPSIIRDPVIAYHQYGRQPLPLIACSALARLALSL